MPPTGVDGHAPDGGDALSSLDLHRPDRTNRKQFAA
jgi:hypothetical protein